MSLTDAQSSAGPPAARGAHVLCPHWSPGATGRRPPIHPSEASTPDSSTKRSWSGSPSAKPGAQRCIPTPTPAGQLHTPPPALPQFPHLSLDPAGPLGGLKAHRRSARHSQHPGLPSSTAAPVRGLLRSLHQDKRRRTKAQRGQASCWWLQKSQERGSLGGAVG